MAIEAVGAEGASSTGRAIAVLEEAELKVLGRLVEASNATLFCEVRATRASGLPAAVVHAVYKPIDGERPLTDFPDGSLARREVAAWHLSELGGWGLVPPTVMRDGPHGPGMLQLWIEVDEEVDVLLTILMRDPRLRAMALFDAVANNADRKGGHILPSADGRLLGCDHGICFSPDPKLRTVLWGWAGEPLLAAERDQLDRLRLQLETPAGGPLRAALEGDELDALTARVAELLAEDRMPVPAADRRAIPWPPF